MKAQVAALTHAAPTTSGTVTMAPRPTPPPSFSGEGKDNVEEWLFKVNVYHDHMKYTTDKARIGDTLTQITGTAFKYFTNLQEKYSAGGNVGTWGEFETWLKRTYEKKMQKEVAQNKLDKAFSGDAGIARCKKSFFTYCKEFRQLAKLTGYENVSLRKKLEDTLPADLKKQFGVFESMGMGFKAPEQWEAYLDANINLYKKKNPNNLEGQHIFVKNEKKEEKKKDAAPAKATTTTTSEKKKSALEDPDTKPIPASAPKGSKWVKNKFNKLVLWWPPHQCAKCGRPNCTFPEDKCKWVDKAKTDSKGAQQSTSGNPPAYKQQSGQKGGHFVKVTTTKTWIPHGEEESSGSSPAPSSARIEEVVEKPASSTLVTAPVGTPPNWGTQYIPWTSIVQQTPERPANAPGFPLQHM